MRRYTFVVLTNSIPGQDAEFNAWYDNVHLHDILQVPGFVAAQRFRQVTLDGESALPYPYLALYEVETDDLEGTRQALAALSNGGTIVVSPSLDTSKVVSGYFEPLTERVVRTQS